MIFLKTETKKGKRHIICNFLLWVAFFSVVTNFILTFFLKTDQNLLIHTIENLLLCFFILFYLFSQITNHRKNKSTVVIASFFMILFSFFQIMIKLDLTSILTLSHIKDFRNQSLVEVIKWSEKNKVDINQIYEYSDLVDEYHIISQNKKEGTLLKNLKSLDVVVSEGANPDKEIIVPDMMTWNSKRVLKYIKENKLNHVEVEFLESDKNKDTVISQSRSGSMRRSDELKLEFSLGNKKQQTDTKLIDFTNMEEFEAIFFLKQHSISYELKKDFSSKVERGHIMSQNKKVGTLMKPNDLENKVILTISKGKKIKVPNLSKYSILEITNWAIKNKLKLEFKNEYDDSIPSGKVISTNYQEKDTIEQKTLITVTISKGKLVMQSFKSLDDFRNWANKHKIHYEEKYEFHTEIKEGDVISYSHKKGDTIKNNDTVTVTISQGKKVFIPNLIGQSKEEAIKKLKSIHIKHNFVYESSTKQKNTIIKQSLSPKSEVSENTTITLTVSNGKKITNSPPTSTNNSSNNNTEQKPATPSCDRSKTTHVYLTPASTGTQTKNNIKKAYPNIKWSFQMVSSCSNGSIASGTICNASSIDDKDLNYCDTYSVIIVN